MPVPKKNTAYVIDIPLVDVTNRPSFIANPTIASGDFKVSTDEGAFANLATLPTVTPASGTNVKISLSADEMNGDRIVVQCIDQTSPKEWDDVIISIYTSNDLSAADVNAEMLDVLQTDTFAELTSIPGATSSIKDKLTFIFMLARNRLEQTSTTATLRRDDTTTAVGTASVSDDGTTATRGEWS